MSEKSPRKLLTEGFAICIDIQFNQNFRLVFSTRLGTINKCLKSDCSWFKQYFSVFQFQATSADIYWKVMKSCSSENYAKHFILFNNERTNYLLERRNIWLKNDLYFLVFYIKKDSYNKKKELHNADVTLRSCRIDFSRKTFNFVDLVLGFGSG